MPVVGQEVSSRGSEEGNRGAEEEGASRFLSEVQTVHYSWVPCFPHRTDSGSGVANSLSHRHSRVTSNPQSVEEVLERDGGFKGHDGTDDSEQPMQRCGDSEHGRVHEAEGVVDWE